mgnify:FL=1
MCDDTDIIPIMLLTWVTYCIQPTPLESVYDLITNNSNAIDANKQAAILNLATSLTGIMGVAGILSDNEQLTLCSYALNHITVLLSSGSMNDTFTLLNEASSVGLIYFLSTQQIEELPEAIIIGTQAANSLFLLNTLKNVINDAAEKNTLIQSGTKTLLTGIILFSLFAIISNINFSNKIYQDVLKDILISTAGTVVGAGSLMQEISNLVNKSIQNITEDRDNRFKKSYFKNYHSIPIQEV